ncbi:hypothetical protein [Sphingobacterium sp. T2]|uniref:hypothetical protein n=1 Tax=Sphingobacterium sp. T2 TaxID=1590596 RepID=UPI000ABDF375|nr:hypothetical protein [Sphingobacterium sp. T2]
MDYTIENGKYYKVLGADGKLITFGELSEGEVLSTNDNVEFISKEEFEQLNPL